MKQRIVQNLSDAIMDYFTANCGRRITNKEIIGRFGIDAKTGRDTLNKLVEMKKLRFEFNASGHGRQYFKPEKDDPQENGLEVKTVFKVYKPGREWDIVNQRLADFRSIKSKFS